VQIIRDSAPLGVMSDAQAVRLASEKSVTSDFVI
jgi:hypothetical protein